MKKTTTGIILLFICQASFCQKTELYVDLNAGLFWFSGLSAGSSSFIIQSNAGPAFNYTNDPYGSKPGVGGGLHVTLQRVTRGGFLLGIAAGPEILKSRVDIDAVSGTTTVPASGSTTLTSKYFNLRPFAGQRFRLNTNLNMDIAGSADLAIGLEYGQEKGSAEITGGNTTVYTDRTRNKTRFDFRPGVQARLHYRRYSFLTGIWFGLTNHYKGYLGADLEAYARLFRAGFGYRFSK